MPKLVIPFSTGNCPKCKGASTGLKLEFKDSCPDNAVCQGVPGEHLHVTCNTCGYTGVMSTADAEDKAVTPTPTPPVAATERPRKVKKHKRHE